MGRAIQGKPAETDAKENGKVARVFKGAFKVEGALISSINRNAEWALNTLVRLEQTAERRPSVLEAMREQAEKTEPAKSSRHLPMIRKAGNCQVHMKGGI